MATAVAPSPQTGQQSVHSPAKPLINPWVIALTVTLATFMELLDTSIANVSLPYIAGGLGRSYDEVTWILTTYLVANAVVLPMSAWLSRVFGRKTYYMACVTASSPSRPSSAASLQLSASCFMAHVSCRASAAAASPRSSKLSSSTPSLPPNAPPPSPSTPLLSSPLPPLAPSSAAGLPTTTTGAGSSSSTSPSASSPSSSPTASSHDPRVYHAEERKTVRDVNGKLRVDGIGIALVGLGSAALEVLLDRGQIDDWFGSLLHHAGCFVVGITCLTAAVLWELHVTPTQSSTSDLLKIRNFGSHCKLLLLHLRLRPLRLHHDDSRSSCNPSTATAPSTRASYLGPAH